MPKNPRVARGNNTGSSLAKSAISCITIGKNRLPISAGMSNGPPKILRPRYKPIAKDAVGANLYSNPLSKICPLERGLHPSPVFVTFHVVVLMVLLVQAL